MPNINKVMLMGNLTRDPISRSISTGSSICEFGLAIDRRYRNMQGEDRRETCYVDVEVWGKIGDNCTRYLRKGNPVCVEGHLRMTQWPDRDSGQTRTRHKVVAESVTFLSSRSDSSAPQPDYRGGAAAYSQQVQSNGSWGPPAADDGAPLPPMPPDIDGEGEFDPGF